MWQDPGNNGEGNTIGLVCHSDLTEKQDIVMNFNEYTFASYSVSQQWILQEDGTVVYGRCSAGKRHVSK
ncbi:MAG: hypothetical protein ACLURV_14290 [Gallintestinimicrobium sp.]